MTCANTCAARCSPGGRGLPTAVTRSANATAPATVCMSTMPRPCPPGISSGGTGSSQLRFFVDLLTERSYFSRRPAQHLLQDLNNKPINRDSLSNHDPFSHIQVAACSEGRYLMAYLPIRRHLIVDTSKLSGERFTVSVYHTAECRLHQCFDWPNSGRFLFTPEWDLDCFVVLDAAASYLMRAGQITGWCCAFMWGFSSWLVSFFIPSGPNDGSAIICHRAPVLRRRAIAIVIATWFNPNWHPNWYKADKRWPFLPRRTGEWGRVWNLSRSLYRSAFQTGERGDRQGSKTWGICGASRVRAQ